MISINYRDPRPIYEQIKFSLRRLILSGTMQPDERLPSVRELSAQLAVNPISVLRASRALDAEGDIYSVAGMGSFLANDNQVDQGRINKLLAQFDEAVTELSYMGYPMQNLICRIGEGGGNHD